MNKLESKIMLNLNTDEQQTLFHHVIDNNLKLNDIFVNEIKPAVDRQLRAQYTLLRATTIDYRQKTIELLEELRETVEAEKMISMNETKQSMDNVFVILIVSILVSSILGVLISIMVSRLVKRNLEKVV